MVKTRVVFWLTLSLMMVQTSVQAEPEITERIEWKKSPIRIELMVGQEQRISFPQSITVGLPANLQSILRTQNVNGTIYLLAHAPFDPTRVMVRELESDQVYLFDISASKKAVAADPIQIFVQQENKQGEEIDPKNKAVSSAKLNYVTLTRFAAQQMYAPARLLKNTSAIVRTPVARGGVNLLRGGAIEAKPLVSWRAGGYYLTAVKLSNQTHQPQTLDPRSLRGRWLTATFQHHRLLPAGDEADTTVVYLISARPFQLSL